MTRNLLHVNLDKSCFIHFPHKNKNLKIIGECNEGTGESIDNDSLQVLIGESIIPQVNEVKFLGITIDSKLCLNAHTEELYKRLKCAIAVIKHITPCIPKENYKTLYHTLFVSHISYGISVWGGIPQYKLNKLFRLQKKCLRILFGNLEQYLDKFNTCARTRPFGAQILTSEFYMGEHTKPIFSENKILTVNNLYQYTTACELMKILKLGYPKALAENFTVSIRNDKNLIILSGHKNNQFNHKASVLWNNLIKPLKIPPIHKVNDVIFKKNLKLFLLEHQQSGDSNIWATHNNQFTL